MLEITQESFYTVVIENPSQFYRVVSDLSRQIAREFGEAVLSIGNKPQDMAKTVRLVVDYSQVSSNAKDIMGKLVDKTAELAMDIAYYEDTLKITSEIERYLNDLLWHIDLQLEPLSITVKQIFKMANIRLVEEDELHERLFNYAKLNCELLGIKLLIFVNLRSYLEQDSFQKFASTLREHDIMAIYLENRVFPLLNMENRLIIDNDLCEI